MVGRRLRLFTGWSMLVGAAGALLDAWATKSSTADMPEWLESALLPGGDMGSGSIGLIPMYVAGTLGLAAFVFVALRLAGPWAAGIAGLGIAGLFVFWYSYPSGATWGALGSIAVGTAVLFLPGWAKFASPLWVASGALGLPALVRPGAQWGPVSSFTLLGAAMAVTGAYLVWGVGSTAPATTPSEAVGK
jgi:hypothetical protein